MTSSFVDDGPAKAARPGLLLIDDDRELCARITGFLAAHGYSVTVVHTGPAGLQHALAASWQAIILEVELPGMNGFEVLKRIRTEQGAPVLMFTKRSDEIDQVTGLELGADDYLNKACSTRHLLARIQSITRRAASAATHRSREVPINEITIAELRIIPEARRATLRGQVLALTPGEFAILLSLAKARGRVKTRDHLLAEIRDREYKTFDRSLDVQVSALRKKLGDHSRCPRFIRTVRSLGYQFIDSPPQLPISPSSASWSAETATSS